VVISILPVNEIPLTNPDLSFELTRLPAGVTLLMMSILSPSANPLLAKETIGLVGLLIGSAVGVVVGVATSPRWTREDSS
jgi:hypothetical protein